MPTIDQHAKLRMLCAGSSWTAKREKPTAAIIGAVAPSGQPLAIQKVLGILRICAVVRIRVHDELSIGEMLSEKECIDRYDDDVLAPMHNQRRMVDLTQHRKTVRLGDHAPLADSSELSAGGL